MSIGEIIRFYRKEKGFTQSELSEILGVSVQAVSKWENNVGLPDISQLVPLSKALGVSADTILGVNNDKELEEIIALREKIGHHPVDFPIAEAERIYNLAYPFFAKHPANPEVAFWCLESLSVLIPEKLHHTAKPDLMKECLRYESCISRYESNADILFKSRYVLARCYKSLGEEERANEIIERIPSTFGDRAYWEAEFAYAEGNMDKALEKCKLSFHDKARYISRCIRLARSISFKTYGEGRLEEQLSLSEYMLTLINAFLSGGDYLPHRMMYQKMALLSGMVGQYADLKMPEKALRCMQQLLCARDSYSEFIKHPEDKHCLMFPEGDDDGIWHITPERIKCYVDGAWERLSAIKDLIDAEELRKSENKYLLFR